MTRTLGAHGPRVFPVSLGCRGMSGMYGASADAESIATIHAAIEGGVNLLDTGDFYGQGHNEMLIGRAISGRRDKVLLSVKCGALRGPDGSWIGIDNRPVAIRNFIGYSLTRLGTDYIDIYRPSRFDPSVPIEDTAGAIADLIKAGYVRYFGLSEVGADTVRRAHAVHPVCDLQIEYALISRRPESTIFPTLRELGIGVTAYGVLSRGLLSGSTPTGPKDFRSYLPRFRAENRDQNQALIQTLHTLAQAHNTTATQLAIAWVLAQQESIVPVIGSRTRAQLAEALAAAQLHLDAEALGRIAAALPPVAGDRYDAHQMRMLDSER